MEATFALYIPLPHVALECEDYPRFLGLFLFYLGSIFDSTLQRLVKPGARSRRGYTTDFPYPTAQIRSVLHQTRDA